MKIFAEQEAQELINSRRRAFKNQLESEAPNYLLNTNETLYAQHLESLSRIEPLQIHFDQKAVSSSEKMIPAEHFGANYNVFGGKSYPKQVITYHIPFEGEAQLLGCRPDRYTMWTHEVEIKNGEICFDIVNFDDKLEHIYARVDNIINHIKPLYGYLCAQVTAYNNGLEAEIRQQVQARKAALQKQLDIVSALGVPIRSDNTPKTFAVPAPERRIIVKPQAPNTAFAPEPTLDEAVYKDILSVVDELGRGMERHPSTYQDKGEEALRDLFLLALTPHFSRSGSVTGETFNQSGKTDILIRYEDSNVFVAECKIWQGAKEFLKALDQLLSYLTWRDSKTALICFVRSQELAKALSQIQSAAPTHPCFVREVSRPSESRFQFEFHLKDDSTRSVQIAALCFHLPKGKTQKTT